MSLLILFFIDEVEVILIGFSITKSLCHVFVSFGINTNSFCVSEIKTKSFFTDESISTALFVITIDHVLLALIIILSQILFLISSFVFSITFHSITSSNSSDFSSSGILSKSSNVSIFRFASLKFNSHKPQFLNEKFQSQSLELLSNICNA
jgi:hypothetical protein